MPKRMQGWLTFGFTVIVILGVASRIPAIGNLIGLNRPPKLAGNGGNNS